MATTGTDILDPAALQGLLGPQLTAEQAALIYRQGQEAVVFALLLCALALAACSGDGGIGPGTTPSQIVSQGGNGQTGFTGDPLSNSLSVRVRIIPSVTAMAASPRRPMAKAFSVGLGIQ